jgi:hypothetical protein
MAAIPKTPEQQIIERIYRSYEDAEAAADAARGGIYLGRLGASTIGNECLRALWFDWRAYARKSFGGRMLRLFKTGHLQEDRIVADLKAAGLQVFEKDSAGRQFEFTDPTGHLVCKVDGVVKGVPESAEKAHVLEIKTHNQTSFNSVVKHGVQKSKEAHYVQMQVGMWLSALTRALYVPLCKNDEQYDIQRIPADRKVQKQIEQKVIKLVEARLRPAGISDNRDSFACKFCDMSGVCYGDEQPLRNCRTCQRCVPGPEGKWFCEMLVGELTQDQQRAACPEYEVL